MERTNTPNRIESNVQKIGISNLDLHPTLAMHKLQTHESMRTHARTPVHSIARMKNNMYSYTLEQIDI